MARSPSTFLNMAKRSGTADLEGPSVKMRREDPEDGGGGRTGRVRKKSAKVLEMEEFEQVEKTHQSGKKSKTAKVGVGLKPEEDEGSAQNITTMVATPKMKVKAPKGPPMIPKSTLAANLMQAPISVTPTPPKSAKPGGALSAQLNKPVSHFLPVQSSGILTTTVKPVENPTDMLAAGIKKEIHDDSQEHSDDSVTASVTVKSEQPQSVIKYLLSSPSSGSKTSVGLAESGAELVGGGGKKSISKKSKIIQEKASKAGKSKTAKQKLDLSSPTEGDDEDEDEDGANSMASLKMRISASSDPQSAQVTLNPKVNAPVMTEKSKKKKGKAVASLESPELVSTIKMESKAEPEDLSSPTSKKPNKKSSKKKEKLIQEAISAVKKLPAPELHELSKPVKKKKKMKMGGEPSIGELEGDLYIDDAEGESNLVIAETEKKKKKSLRKKKPSLKGQSDLKEEEKEKKLSKRAPTAYMLFCNTHRPGIVNQNPGIEFAGISKKLGEMWQTLSTKQKLQWRRKAQRRMKKGSNLISTGKSTVVKEGTLQGAGISLLPPAGASPAAGSAQTAAGIRYINVVHRSPVESPQSPTKLNFSIEPVDVAAHLKLLGESLSIIGMRLQEHKGMIAVQGSLSVLLDSLLCACGPLLCLTQQVPNMDGCDPLVHGQTLDSVAYVMPGL
ncbi:hypothetical protein RRG08_032033 [Elysia crispata]|uniref:HMG box domain-containing protein n=1 Tax=Elysia crispata TaxID=231223 RepID=A0AAE0XW63_9GAST|nr:hypothetical protein RRG08_032033 [Elysia crispata]